MEITFCNGETLSVLGREFVYYRDHVLYWGENLCTAEITFCTGVRICVLWRSISVLGREFVYYGDHFLYWGENLCTTEITFCTGETRAPVKLRFP